MGEIPNPHCSTLLSSFRRSSLQFIGTTLASLRSVNLQGQLCTAAYSPFRFRSGRMTTWSQPPIALSLTTRSHVFERLMPSFWTLLRYWTRRSKLSGSSLRIHAQIDHADMLPLTATSTTLLLSMEPVCVLRRYSLDWKLSFIPFLSHPGPT